MYEELVTEEEALYVKDKGNLFILNSKNQVNSNNTIEYNSDSVEKLSKDEIRMKLKKQNLLYY